jgi:hypothetical protein
MSNLFIVVIQALGVFHINVFFFGKKSPNFSKNLGSATYKLGF